MLALYREGRQADALQAYRDAHALLRDELGLEPSRSLQELERAILTHDASLDAVSRSAAPEAGVAVCPFKGLASFELGDARFFCGRERVVDDLVARLADGTLVGIVGPSGIGKSSVLRAGLLRALASGALPGSETWSTVVLRPGAHPARRARAGPGRARRPDGRRRRSVRGAVHRVRGRVGARGVRPTPRRRRTRPGAADDRRARASRRLLRALRHLPRARASSCRPAMCSSGRCSRTSWPGRSPSRRACRPGGRARSRRRARRRRRRGAGRAAAALDGVARAVATPRRLDAAPRRLPRGRRRARRGRPPRRSDLRRARRRRQADRAHADAASRRR